MNIKNALAKTFAISNSKDITRDDFMNFFRDDSKLNALSVHDRLEVFRTILPGSSDFTADLLNSILEDYNVEGLEVVSYEKQE